jgi:predicted hotdog family 3-hydroxylacyl-ACP dehydratase
LRVRGELPTLCGIEYAAQAMALHGGLIGISDLKRRGGYLVSLREVVCLENRLDQFDADLIVEAELLMNDESRVLYQFGLRIDGIEILSGRATVVLQPNEMKA